MAGKISFEMCLQWFFVCCFLFFFLSFFICMEAGLILPCFFIIHTRGIYFRFSLHPSRFLPLFNATSLRGSICIVQINTATKWKTWIYLVICANVCPEMIFSSIFILNWHHLLHFCQHKHCLLNPFLFVMPIKKKLSLLSLEVIFSVDLVFIHAICRLYLCRVGRGIVLASIIHISFG